MSPAWRLHPAWQELIRISARNFQAYRFRLMGWMVTLMIQLYQANEDETMNETLPGVVYCDGIAKEFTAGQIFEIPHGGSLTITPRLYHRFWAKDDAGVLVGGEISTISVPKTDNRFGENARRFVPIEEDVPPTFLMNIDYPKLHELA